jgi:hypothetical protein
VALNYVTVTGTFDDGSGSPIPATGQRAYCQFTPNQAVYASGVPVILPAQPIQASINSGSMSVQLLATDNTGLTFSGLTGFFFWTVQLVINGQAQPGWSFFLPHTPSPVDLSALANTAASGGGATLPLTTLGDILYENATPAPARLPGNATAAKRFLTQTGTGSVSAAPAWGAITTGDLPAGVGDQAWQFRPETYGAKRDGAFLYDAHMDGSTAILTTAGLPAPPAPTLTPGSGTVAAGTYKVVVTYVNQYGETSGSAETSITVGASSSITITSPKPWTNATAYYVYCTQAGGASGTETRQQALGSPTRLRSSYTISAPPGSGGAAVPASNTSNSAPFTAGDVGKAIVVPSAGGFLNVPLCTTIASFQSATQVTLTAASTSAVNGVGALYGTDDTSAVQQAINAAATYAQASEQASVQALFSAGIYCVAGAPVTGGTTFGNAQITLPYIDPYVGHKVNLALTGSQAAPGPVHWEQPNPPASGTVLACMRGDGTFNVPNGPASVIGGPVNTFGGGGGVFSNMRVLVDGLSVLVPYRPTYAGLDLYGCAQADVRSFSYYCMARTLGAAAGGWPPYLTGSSNPSAWQVFGYRTPTTGNNAQNDCERLTVYGPYYGVIFTDHFSAASIECIFTYYAAVAAVQGAAGNAHHCTIRSLVSEGTSVPLFYPTDGNYATTPSSQAVFIASLQAEDADFIILDTGNSLYGEVHGEMLALTGAFAGGKTGGANVKLVWDYQPLGLVGSPPVVPASTTALTNTYWRDAIVTITGGTVTAIALDGQATGQTSGTVFVRNGGTITLTYSVAPTWSWRLA